METVSIGSFTLESGVILPDVRLAYERTGQPGGPVVLLCHALTGDARAVGDEAMPGWWSGLAGSGKTVDTDVFQVITFNALGGCDGSTGPRSVNPRTGERYRALFPEVTVRDMVRAEQAALEQLGISELAAVIGGSLGGMKTLEWGRLHPKRVKTIIPLAVTPSYGAQGIAFNRIGIEAIRNDPEYRSGGYGEGAVLKGLEIARMAGLVTYRSGGLYEDRFGREQGASGFEVESYLAYQGRKLARRFDPNSYITLLKAMNTHDIGDAVIETDILSLSFKEDLLYPAERMIAWLKRMPKAEWHVIETDFGHDGFLVEFEKWGPIIQKKLATLLPGEVRT